MASPNRERTATNKGDTTMTEEIINKDELKNLRFLLQSGQKLAISTKEFEKVFDEIDRLEQENTKLKEILKSVSGYFIVLENIIPTEMLAEGSGVFGAINDAKKEIGEVLKDEY